nr:DUF1837 domain-containing protein [Alistipes onderdonkii]
MCRSDNLDFDILIDDSFMNICIDESLSPINNKYILSLINDFEDGKWRYTKFQNFIWDNIAETSLSQKEREKLITQSHSILVAAAKNLRLTDKDEVGSGSELAEIILYGIMKHYYHALPVVPKIFYKQNTQDNAKGADSVHIIIENDTDFSLWFGEAKFYNSIEDARLNTIVESVKNSLQTDKLKKENSIITNVCDIDNLIEDNELCAQIKKALSPKESIDTIKPKIHIPILLLHECLITKGVNCLSEDYKNRIITYHKERAHSYFKKQLDQMKTLFKYGEIKFHLILFPVPSKKDIVEKFVSNVEFYKNQ